MIRERIVALCKQFFIAVIQLVVLVPEGFSGGNNYMLTFIVCRQNDFQYC
jgi:hypothetical protein